MSVGEYRIRENWGVSDRERQTDRHCHSNNIYNIIPSYAEQESKQVLN